MTQVHEAAKKIRARTSPGSSVENGKLYHDLPFKGLAGIPHHRSNTQARVAQIAEMVDLRHRKILDLGCGPGGISAGLALAGADRVVGVDLDMQAIGVARAVASHLGLRRCGFAVGDIGELLLEPDPNVWNLAAEGPFDVIIWLSQFMWLRKERGFDSAILALHRASLMAQTMIFETAANDGEAGVKGETQDDVRRWLRRATVYSRIASAPSAGTGWHKRRVFCLSRPMTYWTGDTAEVERSGLDSVTKRYYPPFSWMASREAEALRRLEEIGSDIAPRILWWAPTEIEMGFGGWRGDVTAEMLDEQRPEILRALREAGIRHRDIRPSNLVALDGRVRLIDFGWCLFDEERGCGRPDPPQLNDREDGKGKWGGKALDDEAALEAVARFIGKRKGSGRG